MGSSTTTRRPEPHSSSPSASVLAVDPDDNKPAYTVAMRLRAAVLAYTLPVPVKCGKKDGGWIQQAEAIVRLVLA
jgi:hypothetical protein